MEYKANVFVAEKYFKNSQKKCFRSWQLWQLMLKGFENLKQYIWMSNSTNWNCKFIVQKCLIVKQNFGISSRAVGKEIIILITSFGNLLIVKHRNFLQQMYFFILKAAARNSHFMAFPMEYVRKNKSKIKCFWLWRIKAVLTVTPRHFTLNFGIG